MLIPELGVDIDGLSHAELIEQAHALRTVLRIADAVHVSTDFADLAVRSVDAIVEYTPYASVALFRVNEARRTVVLAAARGFASKTMDTARELPLDGSLTGIAVRDRRVITASDLALDGRVEPATRRELEAEGFVDVALVPVFLRENVIGCLSLLYKRHRKLGAHERATLLAIGQTLGIAMQNRLAGDEQRALEERLRRSQQLESLGVFAGGIAHDFNNLLSGILGNLSLAQRSQASELSALLAEAEKATQRASDLARQLSTLARGGAPLKRRTADLTSVVREAAEFALRGRDVACVFETLSPIEPSVLDAAQLGQVVQNLVLNAAQASPRGAPVHVTLGLDESADARTVELVVRDLGAGIRPEHLERIFDPYFSTRSAGSGLGLAITHAIITRHGGKIRVESVLGAGTTFTVSMPYEPAALDARAAPDEHSPLPARILLVDDEPQIRTLARNILGHLGVEVVVARSCDEAVAAFKDALEEGRRFDGVILDMTMVGSADGVTTLSQLRTLDAGVRAIVSSGYSDDDAVSDYAAYGFIAALPKPYTLPQMTHALRQLRSP